MSTNGTHAASAPGDAASTPQSGKHSMSLNSDTESTAASSGHVTLDPDAKHDPHATRFGDFLKASIKFEASDLIMKTGQKPKIRLRGGPQAPGHHARLG